MCSIIIVKCSWDGLPEGRNCFCVWSFWCSELCSVDQMVTGQIGSVLDVRVQSDFTSYLAHSGWVQFLESGESCTNDSLSSLDYPLYSTEVGFGSWDEQNSTEPDQLWSAEDWFNDGKVELYQQLLWQVELSQMAKEVQSLLGRFYNGVYVSVPLQVLWDGGAQEHEYLHCHYSAVHDGKWEEWRGFLLKSTIISTVLSMLSSRLLGLQQTASSLASCLWAVSKLQELDSGDFRCAVVGVEGEEQWGENTALRSSSADRTSVGCVFSQPSTYRRMRARRAELVWAGGGLGW